MHDINIFSPHKSSYHCKDQISGFACFSVLTILARKSLKNSKTFLDFYTEKEKKEYQITV